MRTELSDGRILIRRHRAEDIPALFEAVRESIPELSPWMPWCHADYAIEETEEFIKAQPEHWDRGEGYGFLITDALTGEVLGGVGLSLINRLHRFANLGYWVRTSRRGRGVAVAAALLAARFGFEELGLQRIEIVAAVENRASQRVAEKAGAYLEGVLRKGLFLREREHNGVLYSLVAEDLGLQPAPQTKAEA
ncbi:MAG TPA: GNAT family protein [Pyrinomonadaceae bacterium]|jgi:RimJ/RimL family protein N-acetyltransferase